MLENAKIERKPISTELEVKVHKMMISENLSNNFAIRKNGFKSKKLFGILNRAISVALYYAEYHKRTIFMPIA